MENLKKRTILLFLFLSCVGYAMPAELFIEAESFENRGGWVVDQQFMDLMGSPYLMAHGMGTPIEDASTTVTFPVTGTYYVFVRTFNWTSPWYTGEGPGRFTLSVDGKPLKTILGAKGTKWLWQSAGKITVHQLKTEIRLHDLTGFNGRCDAIYFTTEEGDLPPEKVEALNTFRRKVLNMPETPVSAGKYDFVVVGGGIAGMCAAISAARLGCRVALVHDRPLLGGNNSSEVRVHLGGHIETGPYKELGNLLKEFGPSRGGNARPADFYEDERKMEIIASEKNITLYTNYRADNVKTDGRKIISVTAKNTMTGEELRFEAPLFADCTGDGSIGYLAGADYRMGRESRAEFGEQTAPAKPDKMTMGASVQWYSADAGKPVRFPVFNYGINFNEQNCKQVKMGEWTWETGMNYDQIKDFERIRDYGLLVIFSNWSFLKNGLKENAAYKNLQLGWVAYISGKRESRRLMGDYVLKEDDIRKNVFHEDGTAAATWSIDLHYPDPANTKYFPGEEFISICDQTSIDPYPIPYRCLYSRNVENLFMAGRDISVTHVALGSIRVMRTTGMLGEVVGMAASLCKKHAVNPRSVYQKYLDELKTLMNEGAGRKGLPNNQKYNN